MMDITYPPECCNVLLFIEKALLNLPLSGKLSNSALQTISAIENLDYVYDCQDKFKVVA